MRITATIIGSLITGLITGALLAFAAQAQMMVTVIMPESLYSFDPKLFSAPAGTTVKWVNNDHFAHNVVIAGVFTSAIIRKGETTAFTFIRKGTYNYICSLHPGVMKGTIVIL